MASVRLCSNLLMTSSVCICPRGQERVPSTTGALLFAFANPGNKHFQWQKTSTSPPFMPPLRLSTSSVLGSGWQYLSDQQHAGAGGHTQITTLMWFIFFVFVGVKKKTLLTVCINCRVSQTFFIQIIILKKNDVALQYFKFWGQQFIFPPKGGEPVWLPPLHPRHPAQWSL